MSKKARPAPRWPLLTLFRRILLVTACSKNVKSSMPDLTFFGQFTTAMDNWELGVVGGGSTFVHPTSRPSLAKKQLQQQHLRRTRTTPMQQAWEGSHKKRH
eukprot:1158851-Pelagomonas_calceolata.AAC.1